VQGDRLVHFFGGASERDVFEKLEYRVRVEFVRGNVVQGQVHLGERGAARDFVDCHEDLASVRRTGGQVVSEDDHPLRVDGVSHRMRGAVSAMDPSGVVTRDGIRKGHGCESDRCGASPDAIRASDHRTSTSTAIRRARSIAPGTQVGARVHAESRVRAVPCDAVSVEIIRLNDAPGYDSDRLVADSILEGSQSNVRIIRLSPGQALPPHRHGASDLMLFAVEGEGVIETGDVPVRFGAGSLAYYRGDEELRVSNDGPAGLTLLAFLAPPFPPRSDT
jgi:mannose-6-phosphate isomerase-like protein (cupin superfamily)